MMTEVTSTKILGLWNSSFSVLGKAEASAYLQVNSGSTIPLVTTGTLCSQNMVDNKLYNEIEIDLTKSIVKENFLMLTCLSMVVQSKVKRTESRNYSL